MQKPSWCLLVMVMYFIPAALASLTHSSASNLTGLNRGGSFCVLADRQLVVVHDPLALAQERVDAPVDEQAELRVLEPALRYSVGTGCGRRLIVWLAHLQRTRVRDHAGGAMAKNQTQVLRFGFQWRRFMVLPRSRSATRPRPDHDLYRAASTASDIPPTFAISSCQVKPPRNNGQTLKKNTKLLVDFLRKPSY